MITVLSEQGQFDVGVRATDDALWLSPADLERVLGWTLKPEGFCQADVCVPIPPSREAEFVVEGDVNAAGFWRHLGKPVVHSDDRQHWYLGESAGERRRQLESLEAPDFTLPDLDGRLHSLSDHRGKKVFLATWASW